MLADIDILERNGFGLFTRQSIFNFFFNLMDSSPNPNTICNVMKTRREKPDDIPTIYLIVKTISKMCWVVGFS